jgi:hypothetical protein
VATGHYSLKIDFGKVIPILGHLGINYVQLFSGVQKIKLMSSRHCVDKHISVLLSYDKAKPFDRLLAIGPGMNFPLLGGTSLYGEVILTIWRISTADKISVEIGFTAF